MDHPKDVYCTTTEFKAHLRHYKEVAKTCVVHITEHGHAGYVFLSIEVYERLKAARIHEAKWQVWAERACRHAFFADNPLPKEPLGEPIEDLPWREAEELIQPQTTIEYLGQPWDEHIARSFDDDVRKRNLSHEDFALVRQCLARLRDNPLAGMHISVGPEAYLDEETKAYRLPAGAHDIIYGIDKQGKLRVYGLIDAR